MRSRKHSRDAAGFILIKHRGKLIPTSVGCRRYEIVYGGIATTKSFPNTLGYIPFGFEHRPELIANLFLGSPSEWWKICERNSIFDVFEQLDVKDQIKIPTR